MNSGIVKILTTSALTFGLMATGQPSSAQFYGGVGLGYSNVYIDDNSLNVSGATASTISKDESDIGRKIFGGYSFNQKFAVELGYVNLGKFTAVRTVTAPAAGTVTTTIKASGVFLDVLGTTSIGNDFSLFGKAGGIYAETKGSAELRGGLAALPGADLNPKETEWTWKLGLGLEYSFSKSLAMRGEWERYFSVGNPSTTGEGNIDLFSINLVVKF